MQSSAAKPGAKKKSLPMWPLYLLLVLLIAAYAIQNNAIIGLGVFVLIVLILVIETKESVSSEGVKKSAWDIVTAVIAAIVIWVALILILGTTAPLDAVASCSMLPNLQRGDLVVLHGVGNFSRFLNRNGIPVVNLTSQQFSAMESNMSSEFLAFYAYTDNNRSRITEILPVGNYTYSVALYDSQCIAKYSYLVQQNNYRLCYVGSNPINNLIKYNYSMENVSVAGQGYRIVSTSSISIAGTTLTENYSNPIMVYSTSSRDAFTGEIIHRLYAALNVNGTYYILTKGDNNPALDVEFGNYPPSQGEVVGYVLAHLPVVGYIKLIISGQIGSTPGCNQVILH